MKKLAAFIATLTIAIALCENVAAEPRKFIPKEPTMALSEIKPGMRGYAKTVFSGTKISSFEIEVLGVLPRKRLPRNLIVIEVKDKFVRENGGIAAGMSGSPVYIGGKLIGAIGYGWSFSDNNFGMVTPIDEMTRAFDWEDEIPGFEIPSIPLEKPADPTAKNESEESESADSDETKADSDADDDESENKEPLESELEEKLGNLEELGELQKKAMPLMVDGISERMSKRLEKQFGVEVVPFGTRADAGSPVNLNWNPQPGAAMGAALAWGDFSAGGIGTLTSVSDDGRFIAFAHPMFNRGAVSYAMAEAGVVKIIPSLTSSFKLGYMGKIAGIVTQDRPQAIGGHIGQLAAASSYTVNFLDADSGKRSTKRFQTVSDPFIGPEIAATGILGLIEAEWGRKGQGTAIVNFKVSGGNMNPTWSRRDIFFSEKDLVKSLQKEIDAMNKIIAHNKFRKIHPYGVTVDVEITKEPRIAYIEKIEIREKKDFYEPGEKITVDVTCRPWRKDAVIHTFTLTVPENAMAFCEIDARGGGIEEPIQEPLVTGVRAISSFEELITELNAKESNNQLIVEINGPELPSGGKGKDDKEKSGKGRSKISGESAKREKETDKKGKSGAQRGKRGSKDSFSPFDMLEDRFVSEIKAERIKDGAMTIADTNYFIDGVQRTFIKIKSKESEDGISDAQLLALIASLQSSKTGGKKSSAADKDEPDNDDGDSDEDDDDDENDDGNWIWGIY